MQRSLAPPEPLGQPVSTGSSQGLHGQTVGMAAEVTVDRVTPDDDGFDDLVLLFEQYRVHYREPADPERARAWLQATMSDGFLLAFLARTSDATAAGLCLVAPCPASLALREFWSVRDVYVVPAQRRRGIGHGLLHAVATAARENGAIRLALQTEEDNEAALALYQEFGFHPVTGLRQFSFGLSPHPR